MARSASRPDPRTIADIVQAPGLLSQLRYRMAQSQARLACILPLLPAPMRPHMQAASIDWIDIDGQQSAVWHVLSPNAAAAAKLRQLQPRLLAQLQTQATSRWIPTNPSAQRQPPTYWVLPPITPH